MGMKDRLEDPLPAAGKASSGLKEEVSKLPKAHSAVPVAQEEVTTAAAAGKWRTAAEKLLDQTSGTSGAVS